MYRRDLARFVCRALARRSFATSLTLRWGASTSGGDSWETSKSGGDGWGSQSGWASSSGDGWGGDSASKSNQSPTEKSPSNAWGGGSSSTGWGTGFSGSTQPRGRGRGRGGNESWGAPDEGGWGSAGGGRGREARGWRANAVPSPSGGFRGTWGAAAAENTDWGTITPAFTETARRVDPLTLTATPVIIDGIKKLVGIRVVVAGIGEETTWHTLKDHMRQSGECTYCKIFRGGRGIVEFSTPEEASRAISELQGTELEGSTIFIREDRDCVVLVNTKRRIREARIARDRALKEQQKKELENPTNTSNEPTKELQDDKESH